MPADTISFLQQWRPGGPWVLTCISTDRKGISTATFSQDTLEQLEAWLAEHNGHRNIYFHVNPTTRPLTKKADREDIAELAWLHVDIDPRAAEERAGRREEEQRRALALLTDDLPQGIPPPTCIIFSGGGYQGFWKLADPFPIDGDLEQAEHAKGWNLQLEILFGADNCHNVDRIMRLPGTVNIPDRKKRDKGRTEVLAELVQFHADRVYPLSQFQRAQPVQSADTQVGAQAQVQVPGNVPRLGDLDELDQWGVKDRVKVIIVQGRHPDEGPKPGDDSRSAWLFDAVCQLVRAEVPDEVIYGVITDPDFAISESVLDCGSAAERYALRQIAKAKEHAVDPRLAEMNDRYAVIENIGGKCRVVEEQEDEVLHRSRLTLMSFADFRNVHMHHSVEVAGANGQPRFIPLGEWWLRNPRRRQFRRLTFSPGLELPHAYNLWRGFAVEARPGDCSLYLQHLRENLCGGNEEHYDYLIKWMARMFQQPASPGQVAVVMRGKKGTGKGFFVKHLGRLLGRHYLHVSNPSHLVGNFNAHLRDALLLFGDEAFYAGDKKHESVLKTLITEDFLTIEAKGVDVEAAPNYCHIVMASNEQWVVPAGADERRFFVLEVGDRHKQDTSYFGLIDDQMRAGGHEALLHYLLALDISEFEVRDVPKTLGLREQVTLSLNPEEEWWYSKLVDGQVFEKSIEPWPTRVKKTDLLEDHIEHMRSYNVARRANPTALGRFLRRVCPGIRSYQGRMTNGERPYYYDLPTLEQARTAWSEVYGPQDWPVVEIVNVELHDETPF